MNKKIAEKISELEQLIQEEGFAFLQSLIIIEDKKDETIFHPHFSFHLDTLPDEIDEESHNLLHAVTGFSILSALLFNPTVSVGTKQKVKKLGRSYLRKLHNSQ